MPPETYNLAVRVQAVLTEAVEICRATADALRLSRQLRARVERVLEDFHDVLRRDQDRFVRGE